MKNLYVTVFAMKFKRTKTYAHELLGWYVGWIRELQFINYLEFACILYFIVILPLERQKLH
jgi:hypothetical protein